MTPGTAPEGPGATEGSGSPEDPAVPGAPTVPSSPTVPDRSVARRLGETSALGILLLLVLVLCGLRLGSHTAPDGVEQRLVLATNAEWGGPLGGASWVVAVLLGPVGGWVSTAVVLVVVRLVRDSRAVLVAAVLVAVPVVLTHVVKDLVGRPRPDTAGLVHVFPAPHGASFPSGHTTIAAALALVLALLLWRGHPRTAGCLVVLLPVVVGLSRVVVGAHFPSDVVAALVVVGAGDLLVWRALPPGRVALLGAPRTRLGGQGN